MATKPTVVTPKKLTTTVAKPVTPTVIDPTKLTGAAERNYRQLNPNSDYTKSVDMRNINTVTDMIKNQQGVSADQMKAYQTNLAKWNMADPTKPQFDPNKMYADMESKINSMFDAQNQSRLAQLQAQKDKATGQLTQQMGQVAPEYAQKRSQADVGKAQEVQRLREIMASQGLTGSGENVTAQTALSNQRLNSLNSLNLQEQQIMDDYRRRIADLNNPADEQALTSSLDAERNKALLDAFNRANDVGYQRQRDSVGDSQWQQSFNLDKAIQEAGLTGKYKGSPTYQAQQDALAEAWKNKEWNQISPAEQAQMALANSYKASSGSSSRSGGSSKSGSTYVKPKTQEQSYRDGLSYWTGKLDEVRQQGAYRVEQALRNDPAQIKAITDQGYNVDEVIDALYNAASSGRFKSKAEYTKYVNKLQKEADKQNGL